MRGKTFQLALLALLMIAGGVIPSSPSTLPLIQPAFARSDKQASVSSWFAQYDDVRHQAQMSQAEKERSQALMAAGLTSCFGSGQAPQDKALVSLLLRRMVERYDRASTQMSALPKIAETRKLNDGYGQYFQQASGLFSDYLKVQNNLFATDASGNSLVGQLSQRKADLEALDAANKQMDARLRQKYNVAPYAFELSAR